MTPASRALPVTCSPPCLVSSPASLASISSSDSVSSASAVSLPPHLAKKQKQNKKSKVEMLLMMHKKQTHHHHHSQPHSNYYYPSSVSDSWWQMSLIRRCSAWIENDVRHVIHHTPFLQRQPQPPNEQSVARLARREVILGRRVGRGGFSDVCDIVAIQLDPQIDATLSESEQQLRRQLADTCLDAQGRSRYVMKHLQERMAPQTSSQKQLQLFSHAAADLAMEGEYLRRLDHPNIIQLLALPLAGLQAWGNEGLVDSYFLILEKVDGTLEDELQQERRFGCPSTTTTSSFFTSTEQDSEQESLLLLTQKLQLALQLAQALDYLHSQRIVFRDLKPHNVGLMYSKNSEKHRVVLLDFGLCRELPSVSSSSSTLPNGDNNNNKTKNDTTDHDDQYCTGLYHMSGVGTRRYMAVEVVNSSRYNCKADVYSWSMLLWELLTLQRPFATYSMEEHAVHVCLQGERPPLTSYCYCYNQSSKSRNNNNPKLRIPLDIQNLLRSCWTEDVTARLHMREVTVLLSSIVRGHYYEQVIHMQDNDNNVMDEVVEQDELETSKTDELTVDRMLINLLVLSPKQQDLAMTVSTADASSFLHGLHAHHHDQQQQQPENNDVHVSSADCGYMEKKRKNSNDNKKTATVELFLRPCLTSVSTQTMSSSDEDEDDRTLTAEGTTATVTATAAKKSFQQFLASPQSVMQLPYTSCSSFMTLSLSTSSIMISPPPSQPTDDRHFNDYYDHHHHHHHHGKNQDLIMETIPAALLMPLAPTTATATTATGMPMPMPMTTTLRMLPTPSSSLARTPTNNDDAPIKSTLLLKQRSRSY